MARRPRWWHTLQEARRQACTAIDFYNRPGDRRSFLDFVVHMHLAWQDLLHADFERRHINYFFRETNGRYIRGKDGERRSWDLRKCLKEDYKERDAVRANIEFFIGLRDKIEHRYQDAFMVATAPHAHANVINFEAELVRRFGATATLSDELRFPLFVQSLTPEGLEQQRKLRRNLPRSAQTYITNFEAQLPADLIHDPKYIYRVQLTPMKGPKTEADLAVNFVRQDDLTDAERQEAEELGKKGMVLVTEKERPVLYKGELLPKQATREIEALIPFRFNMNHFVKMWKHHGVRPASNATDRSKTDHRYCIYSVPYGNYLYTLAYVKRCASELDTRQKFEEVLGVKAVLREQVTDINSMSSKASTTSKRRRPSAS